MSLNKKQSLLQRPKKYTSGENTKNDIEERVDTENDGLLSQVIEMGADNWEPKSNNISKSTTFKPTFRMMMVTLFGCCFIILGINAYKQLKHRAPIQNKSSAYFNGTDYFDTTVIFISLDGFRNDYLERKVTPNIESIASQGIRAEHMYPSFPSITFPNHWTLATGLYPEAHGIVANEFYDPIFNEEYIHKKPEISGNPKWWGGEPIWITSTNQGKKSGVMMWPGSDVPIKSKRPDMYVPYTRNVTAKDKMDLTLGWLDMPKEERPQSISVYIPRVDQKGHGGGPDGKGMNTILVEMDDAIGHLINGLKQRNLDSFVHLVIVSDHGMAGTDKSTLIFFDKIFSAESLSHMREREAWPLLGIRTKENAPADAIDKIYQELQVYTEAHPNPHFQFYKREDIPERYHYKSTERIAPIVMIPDVGYAIIETKDYDISSGKDFRPRGIHGYDNLAYEMRAIFMAKGPKVNYPPGTVVKPFFNTEIYQFLSNLLDLEAAPNNATLDGIFF